MKPSPVSEQIEQLRDSNLSSILVVRKAAQAIPPRRRRLGIFAASFNPPTKAHTALIDEARELYRLHEVLVLLDAQAMDKEIIGADLVERLTMVQELFRMDPKISIGVSNRGLFAEKLAPLRNLYPLPVILFFIVGFDTIVRVMDRRYYGGQETILDTLFEQSRFLVANRGKGDREEFEILLQDPINRKYKEKVSFLNLPKEFSSISSSLIREKLRMNQPIDDLVPSPVLRFIHEAGLYAREIGVER